EEEQAPRPPGRGRRRPRADGLPRHHPARGRQVPRALPGRLIGYLDAEASMSDEIHEYRGKSIVVRFDPPKCIHSRNCVLGRPDVFVAGATSGWIQPDAAPAEEVAAVARSCPSGAITYERLDGAAAEAAPLVNVVRVLENGPLAFHAELSIDGGP